MMVADYEETLADLPPSRPNVPVIVRDQPASVRETDRLIWHQGIIMLRHARRYVRRPVAHTPWRDGTFTV